MINCMSARSKLTLSISAGLLWGVLFQGCFASPVRAQTQTVTADLPSIGVAKDGTIYLNEQPVSLSRLIDEINRTFPKASAVYVRADRRATWASVSQVIAALNSAKIPIKLVSK
jgi:biopolymer transport protein ExbD